MKNIALSVLLVCLSLPALAFAQDGDDYTQRLELAQKMHELRPVRNQVEAAIERYAQTQNPSDRAAFIAAMSSVFNMQTLEKISTDAYAETFTAQELAAMVEYYSKPEARSASAKFGEYSAILYPEIMRMLDRAAMQVKTGQ